MVSHNMVENCLLRSAMILYAERGLVVNGSHNLRLFNQLYWILFSGFFVIAIVIFPVLKFIQGNFAATVAGKICLLVPLTTDSMGIKHCIMSFVPVGLGTIYNMYIKYQVCLFVILYKLDKCTR